MAGESSGTEIIMRARAWGVLVHRRTVPSSHYENCEHQLTDPRRNSRNVLTNASDTELDRPSYWMIVGRDSQRQQGVSP